MAIKSWVSRSQHLQVNLYEVKFISSNILGGQSKEIGNFITQLALPILNRFGKSKQSLTIQTANLNMYTVEHFR